jgi:protein-tyrosine-phosphatase
MERMSSTGNSARSQMAEGILRHEGGGAFEVFSFLQRLGMRRLSRDRRLRMGHGAQR